MTLTVIGVRHHSPACARLVADTIADQRPAYVLIEGPVDMNDRLDELLLGHQLPIAVFTSYKGGDHTHAVVTRGSWSPFCEYSPEWVALSEAREHGAESRFIDLPAWHGAFADRTNRYADAEHRYEEITRRLCAEFAVDNVDTLWDHLVENDPGPDLAARLATYFDLVRGESEASTSDQAREAYMASWIRAALARAGSAANIVVVCGGFHRPALLRLAPAPAADDTWPAVPLPEDGGQAASYLVPYSFRRLDSFDGYQSGMPSPEYYQRLWEHGPAQAAAGLLESVVARLRERRQPVSTADLIAARATAGGLASIRGHRHPSRTDLLDSLVSALVTDALDEPLPWTGRGRLAVGTHPAVVEMVAALSGERVGRLHPDTPLPPLVRDVEATLAAHRLDGSGPTTVDLTTELARSQVLHRLRTLAIPGFTRESGPRAGVDPELTERWIVQPLEGRLVALIEASAYGPSLASAAAARLTERLAASRGVDELATLLFDAILCGVHDLSDDVLATLHTRIGAVTELAPLGRALRVFVGLWRHDRLLGAARSATLAAAITASVPRLLWLVEGVHGGPAPADPLRLAAIAALRDAIVHTGPSLGFGSEEALAVLLRVAADAGVPPDLRGAAFGFCWALGHVDDPVRALRGAAGPTTMGDWLAGLFAVAREQVLDAPELLAVLDTVVAGMSAADFLVGLPALRQAFTYYPPRERELIARRLLERHGGGEARPLPLRLDVDPIAVARAYELESHVDTLLRADGLIAEVDR